jgi:hypothetical protein
MIVVAARDEKPPRLDLATGGEQQDRVPVREVEPDIATLRLCRGNDEKPIPQIHPRSSGLVASADKTSELPILQTQTVLIRPVPRTLSWTAVLPKIVAPRDDANGPIDSPWALHVQGVCADGPVTRWMGSDIAKMKDEHVNDSPNDREPKTDQHFEGIQLQGF